ncbi:MAG: ABC transporter permease [Candidatus Neomarinimicrobiota bacterium]
MMITNYLKIAARNLWKQKGQTLINLSGLSIGMACCLLIMTWVVSELSFDRFHEKADRIYRLGIEANLGGYLKAPITNGPIGPTMVEKYPEVLAAVRTPGPDEEPVRYRDRQFQEENVTYADANFFQVFSFPLLIGNPETVLEVPNQVVIAESMVKKYFDRNDPIGEIISISGTDYTVTGIMADFPRNSQLQFNMIRSMVTLTKLSPQMTDEWMSFSLGTYILLAENVDPAALEAKFPELAEEKLGPIMQALGGTINFWMQPMIEVHLHSNLAIDFDNNGNIAYVYLFSGVALLVLLMACFNFINLSTAKAALRAKEVGIRKTLGAARQQLMGQFLSESILLSLLAMVISVVLVRVGLNNLKNLSGFDFDTSIFSSVWVILAMIGMVIITGVLAGAYPAVFLSRFQPSRILQAGSRSNSGGSRLRRVLVVLQFTISIALLIGTLTISDQIHFINNKELGFDKQNLVYLPQLDRPNLPPIMLLKEELGNVPGVESITSSSRALGSGVHKSIYQPEGFADDDAQAMDNMSMDPDFLGVMDIRLAAGRNFSQALVTDTSEAVMINQTAARKFGWDEPVGKKFYFKPNPGEEGETRTMTVVGMVKDFHLASLHQPIEPLFINCNPENLRVLSVKLNPTGISTTLQRLQEKWTGLVPDSPMIYLFLDNALAENYRQDRDLRSLTTYFSLLAIFIGCLGLFGMASFAATRRTKEIGIRKVLGASVATIVRLLSNEIIVLILVSSALAYPVAWWAMNSWLATFAFRVPFNWLIPVLVTAVTLIIAFLTVAWQSLRAALANPVKSLRYE